MIRRLLFLILLMLLIAPTLASAQAGAWEDILAAQLDANWNIYRITPAGVQAPIALPAGMIVPGANVTQINVSANLRYAVVTQMSADYLTVYPPRVADLKTGQFYEVTLQGQPAAYAISGFDPAGTRFAVSAIYDNMAINGSFAGTFGVVDAGTGAFTDYTAQVAATGLGGGFDGWYMLGDWDANGVYMHPNCYACEPPFEGEFSAWNPDTFAFMPSTGIVFSTFAEQLVLTGELFARSYSTDYPFSTEPSAYFPYQNILVYKPSADYLPTFGSQSGEHLALPESPVIFNDPNVVDLSRGQSEWIADGQYIIVVNNGSGILINRAGGMNSINLGFQPTRLVGTTDGFIALQESANDLIVHYFTVPAMQDQILGTFFNVTRLQVLHSTELGESISPVPAAFTPIQANFAQLEAIMLAAQPVCPGFMRSILFPGQQARITPGTANRMRINATVNSEVVGQVPGGALFEVLAGPVCADNTAWWYINYNGTQGYTAEGMGGEYFVELVRP